MKQTKYMPLMAAAILSIAALSCKDSYLDEDPYSYYSAGHTDPSTIEAQVIGLHRTYAELWGWSGQQGFLSCWQIGTDITSAGATQGVENPFYQYANLNAENAGAQYLWRKCYDFVNHANIIISALGEDNNKPAVAEAKFFRAYAYNTLVTLWGDVPLIEEAITVPRTDLTRQPVAEVDALIEEDLTYAIDNLPEVGAAANESRINKDMARQLAAEAYLRIGMRDNSYYAKAEQAATDIIGSGKYALVEARYGKYLGEGGDYYRDMFRFGNQRRSQGNTEAIWTFEMEYNRDVTGGTIDNPQHRRVWQPAYHKWDGMVNADSLGGRGNGRLRLSNFMKYTVWNGLQGDIRNSNYNIRRYTHYNRPDFSAEIGIDAKGFRVAKDAEAAVRVVTVKTGDLAIPYEADSLEVWYPYPTKWGGYDPTDDFGYAIVKDWSVMRLSETYLLRAEARFRQNNLQGAAADINILRNRAFKDARAASGNASLGSVGAGDITIDFILDERARELIGEENRRMTLARTGKLKDRIALNGDASPSEKIITGFQDYNALLPIPLTEIRLNKDADLRQNPGYEVD
ncbi:MAG: RagB/SusD family nutrient uptake outer membrane protein [Tannerellaceae bacterium]|jgi:hypothetical protein|nr:RagB/SusD family nutrient uptake outer membrane protein [Tannerellaceae bacterium]